jgi:hypothetical protein
MSKGEWAGDEAIWQTISPPMIPTAEDVALILRACQAVLSRTAPPRVLVLGVTPALVDAGWPSGAEIHAVDYDQAMIDLLWLPRENAHCHCARWQEMPFADDHFDLVVGDCSFNALPSLADYPAVLREIVRVKRADAPVIARFFMQSDPRDTLAGLRRDADGRLAGLSSPAKRLLIAIAAAAADASLNLRDVPLRIAERCGPLEEYLAALGQSPAEISRAVRTYASGQHLNYPSSQQILEQFGPFFDEVELAFPAYDAGANCPTVHGRQANGAGSAKG